MDVVLTPDQQDLIREAIASGRYQSEQDAVREALAQWEQAEIHRRNILSALDESEEDDRTGRYADYTDESLPQLAAELKREGRALRRQP